MKEEFLNKVEIIIDGVEYCENDATWQFALEKMLDNDTVFINHLFGNDPRIY